MVVKGQPKTQNPNENKGAKKWIMDCILNDTPPNSLKDLHANSKVETSKKKEKGWGMFLNLQHFGGKKSMLELWDGD